MTVQWDYPFVANGIIRSFVLNIEETDQFEVEKCCEIYPLTEITIIDERKHYVAEVRKYLFSQVIVQQLYFANLVHEYC